MLDTYFDDITFCVHGATKEQQAEIILMDIEDAIEKYGNDHNIDVYESIRMQGFAEEINVWFGK